MATSFFDKKDLQPNNSDLEKVLESCFILWKSLMDFFYDSYEVVETDWKFYSKNAGWCLKICDEKGKNLAFLLPNSNYFIVTINMSVKVRDQIVHTDLSSQNLKLLEDAKIFSEGISVLLRVSTKADLLDVIKVLDFKR